MSLPPPAPANTPARIARLAAAPIVLDTNVCLDLLLFRDPAIAALARAIDDGTLAPVTDPECRDEWRRVLEYPRLALGESERQRLQASYDRTFQLAPAQPEDHPVPLPRCADPDDQKFLELARHTGARWLLSRDRALLALARRMRRDHGLIVLAPSRWSL